MGDATPMFGGVLGRFYQKNSEEQRVKQAQEAQRRQEEDKRRHEEEQRRIQKEEHRCAEQSKAWLQQGLCRYCGGQLSGLIFKKCKSCGKA
jgi:hypothetical protein